MKKSSISTITFSSILVTLGIVFGDIGTSPLYVMKAILGEKEISKLLVYGGISSIFWTLTFQTTLKYVFITLKADNQGEGGIFSLFQLVKKYGKNLVIPTVIGSCALLADGIITPAISVTSAIEGFSKIIPDIPTVPIVITIISILFFFQRFGTQQIGIIFGPIMFIWFSMMFVFGAIQIFYHPDIISALNPIYTLQFITHSFPVNVAGVETTIHGFWLLAGVFLCTTGAEALYSDLGHVGEKNIKISWVFVKICLVVNYLGQASWLTHTGIKNLTTENPFFEIIPSWFLIPSIIIATLAAIIASQALISGSFTLINEAVNLDLWPKVAIRQPSEIKGQTFIPSINIILWLGCVLVVLYFKESTKMEAAYGLAITLTMLMTTILLQFYLRYKLKWNNLFVTFTIGIFFIIEFSFFISNLTKFSEGGVFSILISSIFMGIMYFIYNGKKQTNVFTKYVVLDDFKEKLSILSNDKEIPKYASHLIYLTKTTSPDRIEEKVINSIFSTNPKRADVYWFLHINYLNNPFALEYKVKEIVDDKIIKLDINIGFRIKPKCEFYFKQIIKELLESGELNLSKIDNCVHKYNTQPDFKFVLMKNFISIENDFSLFDDLKLKMYFMLKNLGITDENYFGLEKNDVITEEVPLFLQKSKKLKLKRIDTEIN
ncbi:MAG: KUP/HAK/KT family potassium transporter [Solirubrobacteraceae bacterium]